MIPELSQFVSPITRSLEELHTQLNQLAALHRDSHTWLRNQGLTLTAGADAFVGSGATLFSYAIEEYVAASESYMQVLDQACNAARSCINEVYRAVETVENAALDATLLVMCVAKLILDDVIRDGESAVRSMLGDMLSTLVDTGSSLLHGFTDFVTLHPVDAFHHVERAGGDVVHEIDDATKLLLLSVMCEFASIIQGAVKDCLYVLCILPVPKYVPHVKGSPQTPNGAFDQLEKHPSMETLYQFTVSGEGSNDPVKIVQTGPNTILVIIAGLDMNHSGYVNNLENAIDAGGGNSNDPYVVDVRKMIQDYIGRHPGLGSNPNVIVSGHSFGGIVAQYLAMDNGTTDYTVKEVVTFGSPQVGPHEGNVVDYHQYFSQNDPVPFLSWYEEGPLISRLGTAGALKQLYDMNTGNWQAKQAFINETYVPDIGPYPNLQDWMKAHNYDYKNTPLQPTKQPPWLTQHPTDFTINDVVAQKNYTEYSGTPQDPLVDAHRTLQTLGPRVNSLPTGDDLSTLPGMPNVPGLSNLLPSFGPQDLNSCLLMPPCCLASIGG